MKKQWLLLLVGVFDCLFPAVNPLSAQIWTLTTAPTNAWASVACSADGSKLVAAVDGGENYTSTNSGATWTLTSALDWPSWTCVASSADGTKLAAVSMEAQGNVYISTNSGATWDNRNAGMVFPPLPMYDSPRGSAVCLSADGTKLVVAENIYDGFTDNFDFGLIYTSTNLGATWNAGYESASSVYWSSVACSADGSKLVAAVNGGGIYTSTNSGATWTLTSATAGPRWTCVASSADGTKLAAVSMEALYNVYISTNSGTTWFNRNVGMGFPALPMYDFPYGSAVCLSADGTKLVVAENIYDNIYHNFDFGLIFTSTNLGATWNTGYKSHGYVSGH